MDTPLDVYRRIHASTGDVICAIRTIRMQFGLTLSQAKEIMVQAEGVSTSLSEHQAGLLVAIEEALTGEEKNRGSTSIEDGV